MQQSQRLWLQILEYLYLVFLHISWTLYRRGKSFFKCVSSHHFSKVEDGIEQTISFQSRAPRHIAFLLTDWRYINQDFICSLAHFTLLSDVQRLTLCDPWNYTTGDFHELDNSLAETLSGKHGVRLHNGTLKMEEPTKMSMELCWLRADEWKNTLVQACKKLAAHEEPLTMDDVRTELFQGDDAAEPDFLVSIGSEIHLGVGGLPPWILRNTEFHSYEALGSFVRCSPREFCAILKKFAQRERRFGR